MLRFLPYTVGYDLQNKMVLSVCIENFQIYACGDHFRLSALSLQLVHDLYIIALVRFMINFIVQKLKTVTAQLQETSEFCFRASQPNGSSSFIKTKWCILVSFNKSRSIIKLSELLKFGTIIGMRSQFWYRNKFTWTLLGRSNWGIMFKLIGITKPSDAWCVPGFV